MTLYKINMCSSLPSKHFNAMQVNMLEISHIYRIVTYASEWLPTETGGSAADVQK